MLRLYLFCLLFCLGITIQAQNKKISCGVFGGNYSLSSLVLLPDSTFKVFYEKHPIYFLYEDNEVIEKGKWTVRDDTLILNPHLPPKEIFESELIESEVLGMDSIINLTFNFVKRYYDEDGHLLRADTLQMERTDFAFNENKKENRFRVGNRRTTRCAYAGYIPKEIITNNRTIKILRKTDSITKVYVDFIDFSDIGRGKFEVRRTFSLSNPKTNTFIFNVYANYYNGAQLRQFKILIQNPKKLYIHKKRNGKFDRYSIWWGEAPCLRKYKNL